MSSIKDHPQIAPMTQIEEKKKALTKTQSHGENSTFVALCLCESHPSVSQICAICEICG
jgi:hypothetical protein